MKNLITFIFAVVLAVGLMPSATFAIEASPLSVSCSPSVEYADLNDSVTWSAEVTGGVGPYTYNWSGDDSLSGTSETVDKSYSEAGEKLATVTVSDFETNTEVVECEVVKVLEPLTFNSCSANESNGMVGQTITWSADISGGLAPYDFSWSGTDGLNGSDSSVTIVYSATGTKNASIGTIADARSTTITGDHACSTPVNVFYEPSTMTASCSVSDNSIREGDSVTWSADVSGGDAPYTVEWTGSDDLSTTGNSVSKSYSNTGTKTASMKVTSADGQTLIGIACGSVDVTRRSSNGSGPSSNNNNNNSNSTTTSTSTTPTSTPAVPVLPIVAGANDVDGLNEALAGALNEVPLLVEEGVDNALTALASSTASTSASTSENILEGQTAGLSSLFFANGNFSWISLLVLGLIILGLLLVIWFFLIRKKGDEEKK
jgi:hypothetical protein